MVVSPSSSLPTVAPSRTSVFISLAKNAGKYAVAFLVIVAALLLKLSLQPHIGGESPFLIFFAAVMAAGWYGGWRVGLFATVLAALASSYFFIEPTYSLIPESSGKILRLTIFAIEASLVTLGVSALHSAQRRHRESAKRLRESEALYRLHVDEVKDHAIILLDADRHITSWNAGAEKIFGFTREEMIGQSFAPLFTPEDVSNGIPEEELARARREGRSNNIRWQERRDGTRFYANGSVTAIHDEQGNLRGYSNVLRDDTTRKEAEDALRDALRQLDFHVQNSPLAVIEWDGDFRVARWSGAAEMVFGWTQEEAAGRHFEDWRFVHDEDVPKVRESNAQLLARGSHQEISRNRNYTKDGRVVHCEWYNSALLDAEGKLVSVLSLVLDTTERATLLEREQAARAQAEAANLIKDQFMATLSHELRTPLTPIIGWVNMMRSGALPASDFEHGLGVIDKNAVALSSIINDLLDMSAIMSGKLYLKSAPIDFAAVLREAVETSSEPARSRNISIELRLPPAVEQYPLIVDGDRARLLQIFLNLLNNAVKFSGEGTLVTVACEADERNISAHVEDRGAGIAPDFLPYVFSRFRQSDQTTTRAYGGLGLGLALVKSFTEAHGGSVSAESAGSEQGSRFTVRLPHADTSGNRAASAMIAVKTSSSFPKQMLHRAPAPEAIARRILIAEDAPDTLEMLGTVFKRANYDVTLCRNAHEALEAAAREEFACLVSDIGMPEMNGYDLLRELHKRQRAQNQKPVPAIALTGYAAKADADLALAAGFDHHIAKPVDPDTLVETVGELLLAADAR